MFMRFAQIPVRPEAVEAYTSFYNYRIGPALSEVPGCLFARLIQESSAEMDAGLLSFTVWDSAEAAEAYQQSPLFKQLIDDHEPFAEDTREWKIQLTEDNRLEYKPVIVDPAVQAVPVVGGLKEGDPAKQIGDFTYIRILSATLDSNKLEDVEKLYDEQIAPRLMEFDGCRGAYLIALNDKVDVLSVSVWESKRHADLYDEDVLSSELWNLAKPYMSSLLQWKMSLHPDDRTETTTSDDRSIKGYNIVTGEKA